MGLPDEFTEEEKEAERQKAAAKAAEEAKRKLPVKPISGMPCSPCRHGEGKASGLLLGVAAARVWQGQRAERAQALCS
mgnify:CR=1 FL=1